MHEIAGGLTIVMGLIASGVGILFAAESVQAARRTCRRTASHSAASLGGWGSWFLGGFSGMTMGIRWLYAVGTWMLWTAAGIGLIGLGIRLFD